jgi:hypothetical protein
MLPNELLQKLATAHQGKASTQELEALEKELNSMPDGQAEAGYYRRLWDGFAALRSQQFREETSQWELEASTTDDEELAEWYIAGELSPTQQERLAQRQKTDPEFARIVTEQQQLQTGFAALKTQNFREQIQGWEEEQAPVNVRQLRPRWFRPLAIAAGFLLLLAVGGNWYSQSNYSNTALAGKYYKVTPTGNTLGADTEREAYLEKFDQAHQDLKADKHAAAASVFEQLATQAPPASFSDEDLKYYQDNIDWNLIIARLGAGSTTGDFDLRLNRITQDPDHTYYKQAVALQEDLGSFWRW